MDLRVEGLSASIGGTPILSSVEFRALEGEFVGLIGPNGSGKSTLLRCIYRDLKPDGGKLSLGGEDLLSLGARQAAKLMAVVLQESAADFEFTAYEIVAMGRSPHKGLLDRDTREDREIVEDALDQVQMLDLANRGFATLSGGEKQRVLVARAVAQRAGFLVLDEPTNHLDIRHQLELLELARSLRATVLAALHDLNLAAMYCDRLYALEAGRIVAQGSPGEVLEPALIRRLYGVECDVRPHPVTGSPSLTFYSGA